MYALINHVSINQPRKTHKAILELSEPHIIVAHNLTPSDTATMNKELVLGLATDLGSRTSHTAIMARSLTIPAVVGLHDITEKLEPGQHVLLDGTKRLVIVVATYAALASAGQFEAMCGQVGA